MRLSINIVPRPRYWLATFYVDIGYMYMIVIYNNIC